ncbi:MAG: hypothetical protein ACOCP8_01040 [archaeon]
MDKKIQRIIEIDKILQDKAKQEFTKKEQQIIERYEAKKKEYAIAISVASVVTAKIINLLNEETKK